MVIANKFNIGDIVYIKTEKTSNHYDFEISRKKEILITTNG